MLEQGELRVKKKPGGHQPVQAGQGRPLLLSLYLRSNRSEHPPQRVGTVKNLGSCKKILKTRPKTGRLQKL